MKSIVVLIILVTFVGFAYADPRMETTDNFCHMILDPQNTDNEIFVSGCDSQIVTDNGVATGYFRTIRWMPREEAKALFGDRQRRLSFTSDESNTNCAMVDSNGTEYASGDWDSQIILRMPWRRMNKVVYKLYCRNGQQE